MPAFGIMTGGLDLRHKAMTGLFDRPNLIAHMLGRDRIAKALTWRALN